MVLNVAVLWASLSEPDCTDVPNAFFPTYEPVTLTVRTYRQFTVTVVPFPVGAT